MNKGYIIPRLIFVLLVWAFFYFAFDPLLKWGAIKGLENVFEAKVEIDRIKTSFLNPSIDVYGFKAGDSSNEYRNLFEFQKLRFAMSGRQLLEKKFIIEEGSVKGLQFSTIRKTSCKIYIPKTEMPEFMKDYLSRAKEYSSEKIQEAKTDMVSDIKMDAGQLKSVKLLNEINERYEKEYKEIFQKADFSKYQEKLDSITARYEKIKSEKDFLKQAKELPKLKKDVDSLLKEYKKDRETLSSLVRDTSSFYKELNEARKQDIDSLMSMAKIPSADKEKIAEALLGRDVYERISKGLTYSKQAMKYIPDNPRKKIFEEKTRRGRVVYFPKKENYPRFLLKKASIDGVFTPETPIAYSGFISNVTNQPSLWPQPLTAEIKGSGGGSSIYFKTEARLGENPIATDTRLEYRGIKIGSKQFGSGTSFSLSLQKAVADTFMKLKTSGSEADGSVDIFFTDAALKPDVSSIKYEPLKVSVEKSFASINSFSAKVLLKGKISSPSISIKTDLADVFNDAIKKAFGEEIQKTRRQLEEKLDSQIKGNKEKLDKLLKDNAGKLDSILKGNDGKIDAWQNNITEKLKNSAIKGLPKIKL
ncbi:MAG: hypothetical protein Fur0012_14050 [Elusimicrobiota bacterium]